MVDQLTDPRSTASLAPDRIIYGLNDPILISISDPEELPPL